MTMKDIPSEMLPEILFTNLVLDLSSAAMMALGKIPNPADNKIEINLDMAEMTIEMLSVLQLKTKGNLTDKEDALLTTTLTNLRLNFSKEAEKLTQKPSQG
jgi:hypothetical protein